VREEISIYIGDRKIIACSGHWNAATFSELRLETGTVYRPDNIKSTKRAQLFHFQKINVCPMRNLCCVLLVRG